MKPKNCCKKCRSLGLDFKRDFFCYAYNDTTYATNCSSHQVKEQHFTFARR